MASWWARPSTFPGLLVRNRYQETYANQTLSSAGWLTFVDETLTERLSAKLPSGSAVTTQSVRGGTLFRTGPTPPIGGGVEPGVDALAEVQRVLAPVRLHTCRFAPALIPPEAMGQWLRRLDPDPGP